MLHSSNVAVFAILESAGADLLWMESKENEVSSKDADRTEKWRVPGTEDVLIEIESPSSYRLRIDTDKSFLLAHTFPNEYPTALAILTGGGGVSFEIWGEIKDPKAAVEVYVSGEGSNLPVFPRVLAKPKEGGVKGLRQGRGLEDGKKVLEGETVGCLTQEMLLAADLEILSSAESNNVFSTEQLGEFKVLQRPDVLSRTSHVHVDPYSWFCSCTYSPEIPYDRSGQRVVEDSGSDNKSVISKFLLSSTCRHLKTLPICLHLLAVLLGILNWNTVQQSKLVEICMVSIRNKAP